MANLDAVAEYLRAFYRMVGTVSADSALTENSEAADEVAYTCLDHGIMQAQRFMIGCGMTDRWRARSSALTSWSGADATDGGRYNTLPTDFLRFSGQPRSATKSSLMEANGGRWGVEITADDDYLTGDFFYTKNGQLWITKDASPPATLYLDYQFRHPEFTAAVTLNFPSDAAGLVVAYGARHAMAEGWFPRDTEAERKIKDNCAYWERLARQISRRSKQQRKQTAPRVLGTRFLI